MMMMLLLNCSVAVLILIGLLICVVDSQECEWRVQRGMSKQDFSLDLSNFAKLKIPIICDLEFNENSYWFLEYSPCQNTMPCAQVDDGIANGSYMVTQVSKSTGNCPVYIGKWNRSVKPVWTSIDGIDQYTFSYENGFASGNNCRNGRHINITFKCDPNLVGVPYDLDNVTCIETPYDNIRNVCRYSMDIPTQSACFTRENGSNDGGLGGGWIFLIIVIVLFVFYCVFGYAYNAWKNGNSFQNFSKNVPIPCCNMNAAYSSVNDEDNLIQNSGNTDDTNAL